MIKAARTLHLVFRAAFILQSQKKNGLAFGLTKVNRLNDSLTKHRKPIVSVPSAGPIERSD